MPKKLELIKTQDGSYTFYNPIFDEKYHSISGAYEEAVCKYVRPLSINNDMKILDFCFGLGYNSFASLERKKNIKIIALEIEISIIQQIKQIDYPKELSEIHHKFKNLDSQRFIEDSNGNSINLIIGDAIIEIKKLEENYFDCVFFDPFSLKKHKEIWAKNVFQDIGKTMKINGKLATYSCAKLVRKNMYEAGFEVFDGPSIGRKSPSTIAIWKG